MKIAIGADHGGFPLKEELTKVIRRDGHEVDDLGAFRYDSQDDYPDFSLDVGRAVKSGRVERGIAICGSGVGVSIAANRVKGVRASVCHDTYSARQGVEHDDMNVLCLGGRIIGIVLATEVVRAFLGAQFSKKTQHQRRLSKIVAAE